MSVLGLCALCLTIAGLALSGLASPEREETGQSADLPNHDSKDVILQLSLVTRLAKLEDRFEQKEKEWREGREKLEDRFEQKEKEWREEMENLHASLHRLEEENQRLKKGSNRRPARKICPTTSCGTKKRTIQENPERADGLHPERMETQHRQLTTRSDDTNGLEPVVQQLSLRLGELGADVEALKNGNAQQDLAIQQAATSTFVRWGRSACPPSTELVYAGVAGGADNKGHGGASTSVLCLPLDPVFGNLVKSRYYAELVGAEYQTESSNPAHNNMDPVCAVCRAPRPTTIMVPARNACEDGWVLEYSGYLMGSYPLHPAGHEFVCMDTALEDRVGGAMNQDAMLMYLTFAKCQASSLPCPPYQQDKAITCAVCSK